MALPVYPLSPSQVRGLTWTVLKKPTFKTIVQEGPNGVTLRIAQWQNPVWEWTLIYNYLKDYAQQLQPGNTYTDFRTLLGFFMQQQGQFSDFLYDDPYDDYVGPALLPAGSPNPLAALQLVTDGAGNWYSPIQRNMGGFYEDVTDLNGAITVYSNGVLQLLGTDYTIGGPGLAIPGYSFQGLYLAFLAPPAAPITANFNFYFRVRFNEDDADFEQFMAFLWTIGGEQGKNGKGYIKLTSSRAVTA